MEDADLNGIPTLRGRAARHAGQQADRDEPGPYNRSQLHPALLIFLDGKPVGTGKAKIVPTHFECDEMGLMCRVAVRPARSWGAGFPPPEEANSCLRIRQLPPNPPPAELAGRQAALADDERGYLVDPLVLLEVGEQEGPRTAHLAGVAVDDVEIGADARRKIDLVDHQQVRACDARAALAR